MNGIQRKAQLITEILHDLKIPLNKVDDALSAACLILSAPEGSIILARYMQSMGITTTNEKAVEEMDAVVLAVKDLIEGLTVPEPNVIPKSNENGKAYAEGLLRIFAFTTKEVNHKIKDLLEHGPD
jgi:hypothetical protein